MRQLALLTRALFAVSIVVWGHAAQADGARMRTMTVTGESSVDARPDNATLSLGVTTLSDTAAAAMSGNAASLGAVIARLRAAGVEERDLQTSGLSLSPNWTGYDNGAAPVISGYTASNMLTVRVRDLLLLGEILDAAIRDGANTLNGLTFEVAEPRPIIDEARKRAVADAIARAELLATAAGVKLGRVLTISEGGGFSGPMPMFRAEAAMDAAVPVAAGQIGLSASVTVVFALED